MQNNFFVYFFFFFNNFVLKLFFKIWLCLTLNSELPNFDAIKWQDLLEERKNGRNAFRTGAKIHFSEQNLLALGSL